MHFHTSMLQLPVGGRRESPSRQLSELQIREGGDVEEEVTENNQDYNAKGVLHKLRHPRFVSEAAQSNSRGLRHTRWQWQVQPQWKRGSLYPYPNTTGKQQVSQFKPQM
jgi:hypothetical protein